MAGVMSCKEEIGDNEEIDIVEKYRSQAAQRISGNALAGHVDDLSTRDYVSEEASPACDRDTFMM